MNAPRPELATEIQRSLRLGHLSDRFGESLFNANGTRVRQRSEHLLWDYKEQLSLQDPSAVAKTAKRILAFHNARGGALIIGVTDDFVVKGVADRLVLETARLADKFRKYLGGLIPLASNELRSPGTNKLVWVILISPSDGPIRRLLANGPEKNGKPIVARGDVYARVNDETRTCLDRMDIERYLPYRTVQSQSAYDFEIDAPDFTLLRPHATSFIGREEMCKRVSDKVMNPRLTYVVLDGAGGVGKSEIAIKVVGDLYDAGLFKSIISVSAKDKVWTGAGVSVTTPRFHNLASFVREAGRVLGFGDEGDDDLLRDLVIEKLRDECSPALILLDNLENVHDVEFYDFIAGELPVSTQVLATSRIARQGGYIIPIAEMSDGCSPYSPSLPIPKPEVEWSVLYNPPRGA